MSFPELKKLKRSWLLFCKGLSEWVEQNPVNLLPFKRQLRRYDAASARFDIKSGLNVALLAVPQGMAYALVAGIPVEYGIYTTAIACVLGPLFTGSRFIIFGPTNATAVLLFSFFVRLGVTEAEKLVLLPLLLLFMSMFLIVGAFFRVANLIQFISRSVVSGYITAAAFFIIVNQIPRALGIKFDPSEGASFLGIIKLTCVNLVNVDVSSLLVSIGTGIVFFALNKKVKTLPNVAITLLIVIGLSFVFNVWLGVGNNLRMLSPIDADSWLIAWPTWNGGYLRDLGGMAMILAFICVLEASFIGKSLAARSGERIDVNQEMMGMGIANLGCSLFQAMPASGSLVRSQLNWNSGAKTAFSSVFCGLFCIVGAYTLGKSIGLIPESCLAVLVIFFGISLINRRTIGIVTNTTGSDAVTFFVTFLTAFFIGLDFAIIFGTVTSIAFFLKKAAKPELVEYSFDSKGNLAQLTDKEERMVTEVSIVHVEGELFFGAADLFRDQIRRVCEDTNLKVVILKIRNARHLDATAVLALEELIVYMREKNRFLLISEVRRPVIRVLRNSGLIDIIQRDHIFVDDFKNSTLSTARALKKAQEFLGDQDTKVSIYTDSTNDH
jgi:sulfate permease, SulP family